MSETKYIICMLYGGKWNIIVTDNPYKPFDSFHIFDRIVEYKIINPKNINEALSIFKTEEKMYTYSVDDKINIKDLPLAFLHPNEYFGCIMCEILRESCDNYTSRYIIPPNNPDFDKSIKIALSNFAHTEK
jgi:hypothetical protein